MQYNGIMIIIRNHMTSYDGLMIILSYHQKQFLRLHMDCNDHLYIYDGAHATGNFRVRW